MQLNTTEETVASVAILGAQDWTIDSTVEQPGFERGSKEACAFEKAGKSTTEENILKARIVRSSDLHGFEGMTREGSGAAAIMYGSLFQKLPEKAVDFHSFQCQDVTLWNVHFPF